MTRPADHQRLQDALLSSSPGTLADQTYQWNTKHLPWRLSSDIVAASCASGIVSPFVYMIDRSIIERASSRCSLRASLAKSFSSLATHPFRSFTSRPCLLVSALYFGTYYTANAIDTAVSTITKKSSATTTSGPAKFLATASVNMSLCVYKDSQFTRMFGLPAAGISRAVPRTSYALFALRDAMTIFASFNLPPLIAPVLPISKELERRMTRTNAAQFLAPAGMQLLSTPLHLLGLDLYNRPGRTGIGWKDRMQRIGRDWMGSSAARMARIIPAFGIGGVINTKVRARLMTGC